VVAGRQVNVPELSTERHLRLGLEVELAEDKDAIRLEGGGHRGGDGVIRKEPLGIDTDDLGADHL
jgi:hypothetical protein